MDVVTIEADVASGAAARPAPSAARGRGYWTVPNPALDALDAAQQVTGYERGTITPLGSRAALPVIADERLAGRQITLGAGEHGVAVAVGADDILRELGAQVADVTEPDSAAA